MSRIKTRAQKEQLSRQEIEGELYRIAVRLTSSVHSTSEVRKQLKEPAKKWKADALKRQKHLQSLLQATIEKERDEKFLEEKTYSKSGRTLRKAFDRPRPDLPSNAPANRQRKQVALNLPTDLIEELNVHVAEHGWTRNRFIESAIRDALGKPKPE